MIDAALLLQNPTLLLSRIVHGTVLLLQADATGMQRQIAVLQDGDYFGEAVLLRHMPRTATVRTVSPCIFLALQRVQFACLLSKVQHLRATLAQSLQKRLHVQAALFESNPGR